MELIGISASIFKSQAGEGVESSASMQWTTERKRSAQPFKTELRVQEKSGCSRDYSWEIYILLIDHKWDIVDIVWLIHLINIYWGSTTCQVVNLMRVQAPSPNPMWLPLVIRRTKLQSNHKSLKRFFQGFALDGLRLCKIQVTQWDSGKIPCSPHFLSG